jgi:hypothetical protein
MDKKCGRGRKCIRQSLIQTNEGGGVFTEKTPLLHLLKCELKLTFLSAPLPGEIFSRNKELLINI